MSEAILPRPQGLNSRGIDVSLLLARRGGYRHRPSKRQHQHQPLTGAVTAVDVAFSLDVTPYGCQPPLAAARSCA